MQWGMLPDGRQVVVNDAKSLTRKVGDKEFFVDTQTYVECLLDGRWQVVRKDKLELMGYSYDLK